MSSFKSPLAQTASIIEEEPGETSEGSSSASSVSSAGTLVPPSPRQAGQVNPPSAWHKYFNQELFLDQSRSDLPSAKYHVYLTSPKDPAKDPLFVCHHGAGASGLSFALFARHITQLIPGSGVLSIDAREHGSVVDSSDLSPDFSLQSLAKDLLQMINLTKETMLWNELPKHIVLVGHSLGGAVVSLVAKDGTLGSNLVGFCVIDIVEGSAMEGLKSMQSLLRTRPSSFPSVQSAIDWTLRSRTVRNPESAATSTPALLRATQSGSWAWKTDLASTSPFWEDWFTGLSSNFLAGKAAKLLLLAGTDRLDKELMIGQMQGKFQLQVFPESGHFVQEDMPERVAEVVADFYRRNDRSTLVLPPKVSDLLAQGKKV